MYRVYVYYRDELWSKRDRDNNFHVHKQYIFTRPKHVLKRQNILYRYIWQSLYGGIT